MIPIVLPEKKITSLDKMFSNIKEEINIKINIKEDINSINIKGGEIALVTKKKEYMEDIVKVSRILNLLEIRNTDW